MVRIAREHDSSSDGWRRRQNQQLLVADSRLGKMEYVLELPSVVNIYGVTDHH